MSAQTCSGGASINRFRETRGTVTLGRYGLLRGLLRETGIVADQDSSTFSCDIGSQYVAISTRYEPLRKGRARKRRVGQPPR